MGEVEVSQAAQPRVVLDTDRACVRCSYNLIGLPEDGACPECGAPVSETIHGFLLRHTDAGYLRTIRRGLTLVIAGLASTAILFSVTIIGTLLAAFVGGFDTEAPSVKLAVSLFQFLIVLITLTGYWFYTVPDPGYKGPVRPDRARSIARWAAVAQCASSVIAFACQSVMLLFTDAASLEALEFSVKAFSVCNLVAMIVGFVGVMKYTGWLASRVPDKTLVESARSNTWILPLLTIFGCGFGAVIALVLYWNLMLAVRKRIDQVLQSVAVESAARPKEAGES